MEKDLITVLAGHFEDYINNAYEDVHDRTCVGKLPGGELRKFSGDVQENVMYNLIEEVCFANKLGSNDFIIKKGDLKGNGFIISNPGGTITVGVDWHLYVGDRLILVNECKSYLDAAFLSRAYSYIERIKNVSGNENVKSIITSMEKAVDSSSLGHYMHGSVIDDCYFFLPGTRQSGKPIYLKEYWRPMNKLIIESMIIFIDTVIKESINNDRT